MAPSARFFSKVIAWYSNSSMKVVSSPSLTALAVFARAGYWPLNVTEPPGWI